MARHGHVLERTALVVVGLLALAAGVVGLLLATGWVDRLGEAVVSDGPLITSRTRDFLEDQQTALQVAGTLVGVLVAVIGAVLLRRELPAGRRSDDQVVADIDRGLPGRTVVSGRAVADALERDLESSAQVRSARAEVHPGDNTVFMRLDVDESVSVERIVVDSIDPAIERFRRVADLPATPDVLAELRLVEPEGRRS